MSRDRKSIPSCLRPPPPLRTTNYRPFHLSPSLRTNPPRRPRRALKESVNSRITSRALSPRLVSLKLPPSMPRPSLPPRLEGQSLDKPISRVSTIVTLCTAVDPLSSANPALAESLALQQVLRPLVDLLLLCEATLR